MARKDERDDVPAQSQSMAGPTADNPNEDVADGNQSSIQPGESQGNVTGGETTGDAAAPDGSTAGQ